MTTKKENEMLFRLLFGGTPNGGTSVNLGLVGSADTVDNTRRRPGEEPPKRSYPSPFVLDADERSRRPVGVLLAPDGPTLGEIQKPSTPSPTKPDAEPPPKDAA